ncbi:MAG TPA: cysteine--tRNA ligase [Candidatus Saccharimonadales bacterium]|nr:cysteine--tRNA ligase [Candidatus Saccharimonadales bacterium]
MALRLYDTLTRDKREFQPVTPGQVGMYVCGMTVQDKPHVGHLRSSISGDTLRRYLEHLGYQVTYVYNFTDVDDKIIDRASAEGLSFAQVAQRNIDAYLGASRALNVKPATHYPRATEHIREIQDLIRALLDKGFAYAAEGDVYYDVSRKADYGKLSGQRIEEMRAGARIEVGEHKRSPLDFALWKGSKPGEPFWDSPWGPGRPGWHIECSAMSMKYLGQTFDIHGGGQDLVFPHHENEIAQSEAATGRPFARFWVQNGLVTLGGRKMSKSEKLFFLVEDVLAEVRPEVVRYYLSSTHYRSPIEFSRERLAEADVALSRLEFALEQAGAWGESAPGPPPAAPRAAAEVAEAEKLFFEAMDDDVNTARALGELFNLARAVNRLLEGSPSAGDRAEAWQAGRKLLELGRVMGLFWARPSKEESWPEDIRRLAEERMAARRARDFKRSDDIRQALKAAGVAVEDTPEGYRLKKL